LQGQFASGSPWYLAKMDLRRMASNSLKNGQPHKLIPFSIEQELKNYLIIRFLPVTRENKA
jgi:hypothetical protein